MSSVLETFFLLFDSNADKLKKGYDDAENSAHGFQTRLNSADRAAVELGQHMTETIKGIASAFLGLFAIDRIGESVFHQAQFNNQLLLTSERLEVNIEDFDAYGNAVKRFGGNHDQLAGTLDNINRELISVAVTGHSRTAPFFAELGVHMTDAAGHARPLFDVLGDLSDRFSKIGKQQSAGYGERLGIDPATLLMLQSGRNAVDELIKRQKELGVVTKADAEQARAFIEELDKLRNIFEHVATVVGNAVFPVLIKVGEVIEATTEFLSRHQAVITEFFIGVAGVISTVYLPTVIRAALATWAMLGPYAIAIAVVVGLAAAFALLYDDVMNFLAGNRSVIGELSKQWPEVGETVRAVVKDIGALFEWLKETLYSFVQLNVAAFTFWFGILNAGFRNAGAVIHWFIDTFSLIGARLVKEFPFLAKVFQMLGDAIEAPFHAAIVVIDWVIDKIKHASQYIDVLANAINAVNVSLGFSEAKPDKKTPDKPESPRMTSPTQAVDLLPETRKALEAAKLQITTATSTPFSVLSSAAINPQKSERTITVQVTGPITIETQATDSEGIAASFSEKLQSQIRQSLDHFDDGVKG